MAAKVHVVDFSNTKEGRRFGQPRVEEGDYRMKVVAVDESNTDDDTPMYTFALALVDNPRKMYPYRCKLVESQAWKLRNLLVAAGRTVPKKQVKVDPNKLVGAIVGASLVDDEYEGRERSEIDALFPESELAEEEVAPPKKKAATKKATTSKSRKAAAEPDEDEDALDEFAGEEEDEDEDDLDLDTL
jgi:hypothetical protein